ncbi:hypothetical protein R1sor_000658 [Riccia sorocarpa]|uniref:Reverse transcriptase zinc-binding domain-containing protein n=1 Tax=Riccia sorocarpa TaxID=122646 RepID=A0ABD3GVN4_9MARC
MRLVIATYNVRGICARTARTKLRQFIQGCRPNLDILAIQEHKLRDTNIDFLTFSIWPQAAVFHLPAADGAHTLRNLLVIGGKGGVSILVNPTLAPLIVGHGTLVPLDGGLWLHLDTADGRKLGFVALYAPKASADRTSLWREMESALDTSRNWFLTGDFNMITHPADQFGGTPRTISGAEALLWNNFLHSADLLDTFQRSDGALQFSWDNRRQAVLLAQDQSQNSLPTDGGRVLKRLDQVYADSTLIQKHISTEILPGTGLSDHLPVLAIFHLGSPPAPKKTNFRMNIALLKDPKLKEQIIKLWPIWQKKYEDYGTPALLTLKYCIKRVSKFAQLWGKRLATLRKEKQHRLTLRLHGLLLQLQSDPANVATQLKLQEAQTQLSTWESEKAKWLQQHLDRKWEEDGDRSSKLFFNSIKSRKKQTGIHAIQDEDGSMHTNEEEILDLAAHYFASILQEPPPNPEQHTALDDLLTRSSARVTQPERESLQKDFTIQELHNAAKLLGKNKCPGPDGIPLEFFLLFWDTVSPLIFKATTEGVQQGSILPFFNRGVITLLQKDGDVTLLKNKRPITLLNAIYKIWAKGLQLRLSPILQRLITWDENAFIPGRQLHSTVYLCNEAIFETKKKKSGLANKAMTRKIEALITRYVWGGNEDTKKRHRVAEKILHQRKSDGGLGLMSLQAQTMKLLSPLSQLPLLPWLKISVWGPKTAGVRDTTRSARTGSFARLKQAGIEDIGDITVDGISCLLIQAAVNTSLSITTAIQTAYEKVTDSTPKHRASFRCSSLFAITPPTAPQWCIRLKDEAPTEDSLISAAYASAAFKVIGNTLSPANIRDVPATAEWIRAPIATCWTAPKKTPDRFLLSWTDKNTVIAAMQWIDQTGFLSAPTANIRKLATTDTTMVEKRLSKWNASHHIDLSNAKIWSKVWDKKKPIKVSTLQWYILFQAVPTNSWRFPQASRQDEVTWCICCQSRATEDTEHLFWRCSWAAELWTWAISILHIAFPCSRRWSPKFTHAILGIDPPDYCKTATKWWEQWRSIILWIIWILRNDMAFRNLPPSLSKAKALAWFNLLGRTRKDWEAHCIHASAQDLTLARRAELNRRVGRKLAVFTLRFRIAGHRLFSTWRPP